MVIIMPHYPITIPSVIWPSFMILNLMIMNYNTITTIKSNTWTIQWKNIWTAWRNTGKWKRPTVKQSVDPSFGLTIQSIIKYIYSWKYMYFRIVMKFAGNFNHKFHLTKEKYIYSFHIRTTVNCMNVYFWVEKTLKIYIYFFIYSCNYYKNWEICWSDKEMN